MAEIIWTEPALNSLNDIAEYIALNNPISAKNLVGSIFCQVTRLEQFPESGSKPEEIKDLNYREIVVNPCRIFYKIKGDNVYIVFVMRQDQDLRRFLIDNKI